MIAVIFEALPSPAGRQPYLDTAAALRGELERMDGFVSIERFESLSQPGKLLSLSLWRDEAAVAQWRQRESHRHAQAAGRAGWLADYRLRVAAVLRDYGLSERAQAPADLRAVHDARVNRQDRASETAGYAPPRRSRPAPRPRAPPQAVRG